MFKQSSTDILVQCCRVSLDRDALANTLAICTDWEDLMQAAIWHNVRPQLLSAVQAIGVEAVPVNYLNNLRSVVRGLAARNVWMTRELLDLVVLYRQNDIRALSLKGPALALAVHSNVARREFSDLDLLIREADVLKVRSLMIARGYVAEGSFSIPGEKGLIRERYQMTFVDPQGRSVEIHWGLQEAKFVGTRINTNAWWGRSAELNFDGERLEIPNRADLLLFLCAHGAKHSWDRLKWLEDVALSFQALPDQEGQEFIGRARESRALGIVRMAAALARDILGAVLPSAIEAVTTSNPLTREVRAGWSSQPGLLRNARIHLALTERMRDKLRYCLHHALIPTVAERQAIQLPQSLVLLYGIIRPLRLMAQESSRLVRARN